MPPDVSPVSAPKDSGLQSLDLDGAPAPLAPAGSSDSPVLSPVMKGSRKKDKAEVRRPA